MSSAWRNAIQLFDPSVWLHRDPEAEEKMLRDADIAQAITQRKHLIAGQEWTLIPRDEASPRSDLSVHVGTELLKGIKHFTGARLLMARAFFSGARFARIHMEPRVLRIGDGKERTWLVPFRLEDMDKRMYRIVPKNDGKTIQAHWQRWNVAKSDWEDESVLDAVRTIRHVYQDDQGSLGHGRGLREALGWIWYTKTHVMQETVQAVEKYAQGTMHLKMDMTRDAETGKVNEVLVQEALDMLEDMRARHVIVTDKSDDLEIIGGNAEGWQLLDVMEQKLATKATVLILGSNLPTTADKGGSFALGKVQQDSTTELVGFDREILEETYTDDLLGCVWFENHANLAEMGIVDEKPRFSITQKKHQEPKERAEVASVANGMGLRLSEDDLYEQIGFRKPEEGEDVLAGAARDPFGSFGGIGGQVTADPTSPIPGLTDTAVPQPVIQEVQDTALNGAQVTAAAEIIDRVVNNAMPPGTAIRMLVAMFNLPLSEAKAMVDEAAAFTPAVKAAATPPPAVPTGAPE